MTTIVLNDVVSNNNTSVMNANFQKIEDAINDDLLHREIVTGQSNEMRTHFDLNSNKIVNLANGTLDQDAATVSQLVEATPVKGVDYFDGVDGIDGTNGIDGVAGAVGPQGEQGIQGIQGIQGEPGVDGIDGIDGTGLVNAVIGGTNCTVDATDPTQPIVNVAGGGLSPLTTKGDMYTYDTGDQRLAVGTDGQVLTVDSGEATGVKWTTPSASGLISDTTLAAASDKVGLTLDNLTEFDFELHIPTMTVHEVLSIHFNGDYTSGNYRAERATAYDTFMTVSEYDSSTIGRSSLLAYTLIIGKVRHVGSNIRAQSTCSASASVTQDLFDACSVLHQTATSDINAVYFDCATEDFPIGTRLIIKSAW
jgi:hypothetical protein